MLRGGSPSGEDARTLAARLKELPEKHEIGVRAFRGVLEQVLAIANSKDDWSGLVYYVKALKAKRDGADDAFRTNILEAVWSNPNQAALFAEVVSRVGLPKN